MATSLLQGGADMEQEDREDLTALHWAARLGQERVVLVLLEHAADVEVHPAVKNISAFTTNARVGCGRSFPAGQLFLLPTGRLSVFLLWEVRQKTESQLGGQSVARPAPPVSPSCSS